MDAPMSIPHFIYVPRGYIIKNLNLLQIDWICDKAIERELYEFKNIQTHIAEAKR